MMELPDILVCGAGGTLGEAWMRGLLHGLEDGHVRLVCAGLAHELRKGDAVTFDADLPHHFENPGPGEAAILAVVSAGLRRS